MINKLLNATEIHIINGFISFECEEDIILFDIYSNEILSNYTTYTSNDIKGIDRFNLHCLFNYYVVDDISINSNYIIYELGTKNGNIIGDFNYKGEELDGYLKITLNPSLYKKALSRYKINSHLVLKGENIDSLSGLPKIIHGTLHIENTSISSLEGLPTKINNKLIFIDNKFITEEMVSNIPNETSKYIEYNEKVIK